MKGENPIHWENVVWQR